jgi:hypothetical protein
MVACSRLAAGPDVVNPARDVAVALDADYQILLGTPEDD